MRKRIDVAVLTALLVAACMEPRQVNSPSAALGRDEIGVGLSVSDSAPRPGATVSVLVRLVGASGQAPAVGSYTARLSYDTLAFRYAGELALGDRATRIVNPVAGNLRAAGIATGGMAGGRIFGVLFQVRDARAVAALRDIRVSFAELHSTAREDLRVRLRPMGLTSGGTGLVGMP